MTGRHSPTPGTYRWRDYRRFYPDRGYPADRNWSTDDWPLLADDLWRLAHNDNGSRKLDPQATGLGLGAALLTELLISGAVTLDERQHLRLTLTSYQELSRREFLGDRTPLLPDEIACDLLAMVAAEPQPLPLSDWIEYAAKRATDRVARRMLAAEHLVQHRRLLHRGSAYLPTDGNIAAWPAVRLLGPLQQPTPQELTDFDLVLLDLCRTLGLHRWLLTGYTAGEAAYLCRLPGAVLPSEFLQVSACLEGVLATHANRLR